MDWQSLSKFLPKPDFSFDNKTVELINKNRKELGGTLFFDRIWHSLALTPQPQKVYPPKSNQDLKNLCQNIIKAEQVTVDERKYAILYYILRDCRLGTSSSKSGGHHGDIKFANAVFLPHKYQTLVSGIWEMDHLHFSVALTHLTDPCLGSDFATEVIELLLSHPKSDDAMALGYYVAKSPLITDLSSMQKFFSLLLRTDMSEAYKFCQQQSEYQEQLFEDLVRFALSQEEGQQRAELSKLLVSLPLSSEEDEWLEDFLLHGDGAKLFGAKDTVIMRRIVCQKPLEGLGVLDRHKGSKSSNINWDDIRTEMQRVTG